MAQILVRNFKESAKTRLQSRARQNGRSMEAEVREILYDVLEEKEPQVGFGTATHELFKDCGLDEPFPEIRGMRMEIPTFDE